MSARARLSLASSGHLQDLTGVRIVRALKGRQRYRYVQPSVVVNQAGWQVNSPCCSRNVDPQGGEIPIALVTFCQARHSQRARGLWQLFCRDHQSKQWVLHTESASLDALLHTLCADDGRVFWP